MYGKAENEAVGVGKRILCKGYKCMNRLKTYFYKTFRHVVPAEVVPVLQSPLLRSVEIEIEQKQHKEDQPDQWRKRNEKSVFLSLKEGKIIPNFFLR